MARILLLPLLLCTLFMSGSLLTLGHREDANSSSCIEKERKALLDVKANLIDLHGNLLSSWGSQEELDCCKWVGVSCNSRTGHVIELDLEFYSPKSFKGTFSPSLQVLNQLQDLNLNYIDFQSNPLPEFLASLSNLKRLHISGANLSGPIPHQLTNLSNLLHIDLSYNFLGGFIPFSFGDLTSLAYLNVSQNHLVGVHLKSFENCSSLVQLDLSLNLLSGMLPSFAGCTSLRNLDLSSNFLSGNMPNAVSLLSNLEYLDVSHNCLNGSIPNFIRCTSLSFLDMSNNQFFGNVPTDLGLVSNLGFLDFSSNSLEGIISEVHFQILTHLYFLDFSFNSLVLDFSIHWKIPFQLLTIKLRSCKLGPRFPVWIKTQKYFRHLDISNAGISDTAPDWFWDLPVQLEYLNISSNEIKGMQPGQLSFNGYPGIDLSNNRFQGDVRLFSFRLAALNLSGNKFTGTLLFLCGIDGLTFLDVSNNSLSGSLPDCWLQFSEKLVVLNLSNNNLSGEIPSSLGFLYRLQALYLRGNTFVGEIPVSLRNCTRLKFMDLGENKLSGVIPKWIGEELSNLYALVLQSNRFYGKLPSHVCWLSNLQVLDLSNNKLSGDIPRCFDNFTAMARRSLGDDMTNHAYSSYIGYEYLPLKKDQATCMMIPGCGHGPPNQESLFLDNAWIAWKGTKRSFERSGLQLLKSIDLSRNNLSGNLPSEINSLYGLISLNLSINKLHGEVPKYMDRMSSLESLDLSRNQFSGHIPRSLAKLNFLSYLDLSNNNFSGSIPTGPQLQGFSYTFYSGNPQLCGPPLTTPKCLVRMNNVEEDEDDYWKSYYIGSCVGFVVGFWGIVGALFLNLPSRYFVFAWLSQMKDRIYVIVVYFGKLQRKLRR